MRSSHKGDHKFTDKHATRRCANNTEGVSSLSQTIKARSSWVLDVTIMMIFFSVLLFATSVLAACPPGTVQGKSVTHYCVDRMWFRLSLGYARYASSKATVVDLAGAVWGGVPPLGTFSRFKNHQRN